MARGEIVMKQELEVPSWQAVREYLAELMDLYLSASASKATAAVLADVVEETMELVLTAWLNCVNFADKRIWRTLADAQARWLTHPRADSISANQHTSSKLAPRLPASSQTLSTVVVGCWERELLRWSHILISLLGSFRDAHEELTRSSLGALCLRHWRQC